MALYPDACTYDEFITKIEAGSYTDLTPSQYVEIIKELINDLSSKYSDEDYEELQGENERLESEIDSLGRELESLQDDNDNLQYENERLKEELEELKAQ